MIEDALNGPSDALARTRTTLDGKSWRPDDRELGGDKQPVQQNQDGDDQDGEQAIHVDAPAGCCRA
jgi:hypothetical protein